MRAVVGLVSLLVVIAIIYLVFIKVEAPAIQQGEKAKDEARQISGRGDDGKAAIDSFKTQPKMRGSTLDALTVTDVTPGGALAQYGLQKGDEITQVNGMKVGDLSVNDPETAKAMVVQNGFQAMAPIVVMRDGKQITLPDKGGAASGSPAPGSPAPAAPNTVQNQLKNLGIQTK